MFREKFFTYHLQILYQTTSGLWRYLENQLEYQLFQSQLEKVQYKACYAVTGAFQGIARQKFTMN